MQLRSGRRVGSPPRGGRPRRRMAMEEDRFSGLPDELLLDVLARLGCAREAARTGVLSRRWRGLWTELRALTFNFHGVGPDSAVSALTQVSSLLGAADRRAPLELVVTVRNEEEVYDDIDIDIELPLFRRATSIQLHGLPLSLHRGWQQQLSDSPAGDFGSLEELSLTYCTFGDPGVLVARCPRLRKLRMVEVLVPASAAAVETFTVESKSLEELILGLNNLFYNHPWSVHIVAPELNKFSFTSRESGALSMKLSAPKMEDFNMCYGYIYDGVRVGFGDDWKLGSFSVRSSEWSNRRRQGHLPRVRVRVLSLSVEFTQKRAPAQPQRTIAQEIARPGDRLLRLAAATRITQPHFWCACAAAAAYANFHTKD